VKYTRTVMLDIAELPVFVTKKSNCDCCVLSVPPPIILTVGVLPHGHSVALGVMIGVLVLVGVTGVLVFVGVSVGVPGVLVKVAVLVGVIVPLV